MLGYAGLGFAKASILVLYIRIFNVRNFRLQAKFMLGLVSAWAITFFFASLFQCYPITANMEPFWGNHCVNTIVMWYIGAATDIVGDILILLMPIPPVLKLQLPLKKKLGVLSMFLLGAM